MDITTKGEISSGGAWSLTRQAQHAHAKGMAEHAISLYQQALGASSGEELLTAVINLGALLRQKGDAKAAREHYRTWLQKLKPSPALCLNAWNCLRELSCAAEGLEAVEQCLLTHPDSNELWVAKSECLLDLNRTNESQLLLEQLVHKQPKLRQGWVNLGIVLAQQGKLELSLSAFERAASLGDNEGNMRANRISLLKDLGRLEEAEALWAEMNYKDRDKVSVRGARAGLLLAQNKLSEASLLLQQLCQVQPAEATHWLNWAASLRGLKYTVAPVSVLKRALQHHPSHWELLEALGQCLAEMGSSAKAKRLWNLQAPRPLSKLKDVHIFNRQFLGISEPNLGTVDLADQARCWEQQKQRRGVGTLWADHLLEEADGRPIRVGYLTSDACNHPVGRFLLPILKNHNKENVESWIISGGQHYDWISKQLQHASTHWLCLNGQNDLQAARLIADLRLDLIVELGGFTGESRIGVLVHRPAPIQLSFLGYPAPTRLMNIDGWIGDKHLFGGLDEKDRSYHRLLNIEGGYMAFDAGEGIKMPTRQAGEKFTFGCFNHARKLTDECIDLFVAVLKAVPDAALVLKSISFHEAAERLRIQQRFARAGLPEERLTLLAWVEGGANHLMRYSQMDVALDPIPYGGATTTCEALWMGIPVVCLAGRGMAGRLSTSILHGAGCDEWIADNQEEYISIASQLASQGRRFHEQRIALREKVRTSALCDAQRLSRALEGLYRVERRRLKGI